MEDHNQQFYATSY